MSRFSKMLKEHLNFQDPTQRLQDHLDIPGTHLSLCTIELPEEVISLYAENTLRTAECINQRLEDIQIKFDLPNRTHQKLSAAECIDQWRNYLQFESDPINILHFKENLFLNGLSIEDGYARLLHHIVMGQIPNRKFRIHLKDVVVPISICHNQRIHVLHLSLKSLSQDALLFQLTSEQERLLKESTLAQIHLSPSALFHCHDPEILKLMPSLSYRGSAKIEKRRICTFDLDIKMIKWSISHLHLLRSSDECLNKSFASIPFSALFDSYLMSEAKEVKGLIEDKLNFLEEDLIKLLASSS
jgi:hypothetical protein